MELVYGPVLLLALGGTITGSTDVAKFKFLLRFAGAIFKTLHLIAINAFLVAIFASRVSLE